MSNPVVLITGALTGIDRAIAIAFAKDGAHLVVSGRSQDAGEALATELRALGAEAEFIRADVRHEDRPISARLYRWGGSASRMSRMSTQVVLITGGLTGIGRAAA